MGAALSWVREPSHEHEVALATKLGLQPHHQGVAHLPTPVLPPALAQTGILSVGLGSGMLLAAVYQRLTGPCARDEAGGAPVLEVEQKVGLAGLALMLAGVLILSVEEGGGGESLHHS